MDELLNNAPCGFLTVDDNGKIVEANQTLLNLLGYERGELLASPIEKLFSVAGRIFYQTHFFPLLKLQNKAEEIYLALRSKTGAEVPVLVNAFRRSDNDEIFNDCVFVPMRQRNLYENEILQAKKEAEAATRAKDEFLSVVSHDLRTPLSAIIGWARILENGKVTETETIKHAIRVINRNAQTQLQLIDDILDFARIKSGKMRLEFRTIDLAKTIETAVEAVAPSAEQKNIKLEIVCGKSAFIRGDETRLEQVLWNLLQNAVKFTPDGGAVKIALRQVDSTNKSVEFSVSDTGRGIGADFLPHVFESFEQADNAEKSKRVGGLGLGLAISRHIVEQHGGTIRVESAGENLGATFTVTLPAMPSENEQSGV
jgi:PAS domain S-box-containing protein